MAIATVVGTERSAPRDPAVLAVSAGARSPAPSPAAASSRPSTARPATSSPRGASAQDLRHRRRGGLRGRARGGTVHIFVDRLDPSSSSPSPRRCARSARSRSRSRSRARKRAPSGSSAPTTRARRPSSSPAARPRSSTRPRADLRLLLRAPSEHVRLRSRRPRRRGRLRRPLPYRVTVCDARSKFVTPSASRTWTSSSSSGPTSSCERPVDERTVICVLTHDHKFDVPALKVALQTPAATSAMGARRTNEDRAERLRAEGVPIASTPRSA